MSWFTDKLDKIVTGVLGTSRIDFDEQGRRTDRRIGGWFNNQPTPTPSQQYSTPTPTPTQQYQPTPTPRVLSEQYQAPTQPTGPTGLSGDVRPSARGRIEQTNLMSIASQVDDAIQSAAKQYNVSPELLYDIAFAESSLDPMKTNAEGSSASGLFQFTSPTWQTVQRYGGMPGSSLRLPSNDRSDPYASAMAAAYLIGHGQLGRWDASKWNWGQYYTPEEIDPYYYQTLGYEQGGE